MTDPQHEQQYGNEYGHPLGRRGNGLGNIRGASGRDDDTNPRRRPRLTDNPPHWEVEEAYEYGDEEESSSESSLDIGDIILLIASLTERQRFVLELRYGLRDGECYTLDEIAALMGVRHQTVSEHEQVALMTLQKLVSGG